MVNIWTHIEEVNAFMSELSENKSLTGKVLARCPAVADCCNSMGRLSKEMESGRCTCAHADTTRSRGIFYMFGIIPLHIHLHTLTSIFTYMNMLLI